MKFSGRVPARLDANRPTRALSELRAQGKTILDLTVSNPTRVGIEYPEEAIREALGLSSAQQYDPDPQGLLKAREAVAEDYSRKGIPVDPRDLFLTASSSEAYSLVFKLLLDPDHAVLAPRPGYPLIPLLAQAEAVRSIPWDSRFDGAWRPDLSPLERPLDEGIRLAAVVHPNNPTGAFLKGDEWKALRQTCLDRGWAAVCDEVFGDYRFNAARPDSNRNRAPHTSSQAVAPSPQPLFESAREDQVPLFVLNGLSKSCGLPQMKLGWILLAGGSEGRGEIRRRLQFLCDSYLSASTPIQSAARRLLAAGRSVRRNIRRRILSNHHTLVSALDGSPFQTLPVEGGWSAIIRLPRIRNEEDWCLLLLRRRGVWTHPGYFYDLPGGPFLVLSLITPQDVLEEGVSHLLSLL